MRKLFLLILIFSTFQYTYSQRYYTPSQRRALARRAAIIDGYRQLAEAVKGVKISSQTTVKDFVTESDTIKADMNSFILRGAQTIATRYLPDGTCEVDMKLHLEDVIRFLMHSRRYTKGYTRHNFHQIQNYNARTIKATGTGAPPGELSNVQESQLKSDNVSLKSQMRKLQEVIFDLRNKLAQAKTSQKNFESLVRANNALKKQLNKSRLYNARLMKELQKSKSIEVKLKQERHNALLTMKINKSLKASLKKLKKENKILRSKMMSFSQTFQELKEYEQKYNSLIVKYRKFQSRVKELQNMLTVYQGYQGRYNELLSKNRKLEKKISDIQSLFVVYKGYQGKFNTLTMKNKELKAQLKNCMTQMNVLLRANRKMKKQLSNTFYLQKNYQKAIEMNKRLVAQIAGLQTALKRLQEEAKFLNALQSENEQLKSQMKNMQNLLVKLRNHAHMLQSKIQGYVSKPQGNWRKISPRQKLMARRAAIMDAYRQLLEALKGVRINSKTTVKDFVTENDEIAAATAGFLKGAQVTQTRYLSDGTCEVEMYVTTENFIRFLKQTAKYSQNWKPHHFNNIPKYERKNIIKVIGTGAIKD